MIRRVTPLIRLFCFSFKVSFVYQTTGEILSFGLELFLPTNRLKLYLFSSNRLDLKIHSVHENDSGLYSCFNHHDELSSYHLQVLSKRSSSSFTSN